MIIDSVENRPVPRYLIYDIIKFDVSWFQYIVRYSFLSELFFISL